MGTHPAIADPGQKRVASALMPEVKTLPEPPTFRQVSVKRSNYRRVVWGHVLTSAGVLGILGGAIGMIVMSSRAGRDKGPAALADPQLARRYRRQFRGGRILLFSGLSVGLVGLVSGPLLVRSGRRRQRAEWSGQNLAWRF